MKFRMPNKFSQNIPNIVRSCGYFKITDNLTKKDSYVRELTKNRYPRFHLYVSESPKETVFDLHLDQTKTRYAGQNAHGADYESDEVRSELTKIFQKVSNFQR